MKRFIVYDQIDGRILRSGVCADVEAFTGITLLDLQAEAGEEAMEGSADDRFQYIKDREVIERPVMVASIDRTTMTADGTDYCTLSGLPIPCEVYIDKTRYVVPDGIAELTLDTPGTYKVVCRAFPYLDWEMEVTGA